MHFPMVVNWREKECGYDAKEGADKDSVYSSVPLKSVGLNLLFSSPREAKLTLAVHSSFVFLPQMLQRS